MSLHGSMMLIVVRVNWLNIYSNESSTLKWQVIIIASFPLSTDEIAEYM